MAMGLVIEGWARKTGEEYPISNIQCPMSNDQGGANTPADFPRRGNYFSGFSTAWKLFFRIFHGMEKQAGIFPQCGKKFSTVWKTGGTGRMRGWEKADSPMA
jgi:hypothetical protein